MAEPYVRGMELLVGVVQELSHARTLAAVQAIVGSAARALTGADGATLVLREGNDSFYADEDAIAPLWKGKRFPMSTCISGWAMIHKAAVVIEDIYEDDRVPHDAYRPTFVKSLAMVPIRADKTADAIGAIGSYWAERHAPTDAELRLLQALADSTSIALENVRLYAELEARVRDRTAALEATSSELEAFAYSVSHDLRAPLRAIHGFTTALAEDAGDRLDDTSKGHLDRVVKSVTRMNGLIDALLGLSRVARVPLERTRVDLTALAREVASELSEEHRGRNVRFVVADGLTELADAKLVRVVLANLLGNAWKFTTKNPNATVELGAENAAFFVRDDGVGFDATYASKLFAPFQRLCSADEFPGTGIGLATVQRIARRHGGAVWAESAVGKGATFWFTLRQPHE